MTVFFKEYVLLALMLMLRVSAVAMSALGSHLNTVPQVVTTFTSPVGIYQLLRYVYVHIDPPACSTVLLGIWSRKVKARLSSPGCGLRGCS